MKISRDQLDAAVRDGMLSADQSRALWDFLSRSARDTPSLRAPHILYYLGGLLAMASMTLLVPLSWSRFGGWGLFAIAMTYALLGLWLTERFMRRARLRIPAGITAAFTVVLVPLGIFGLQSAAGLWPPDRDYRDFHVLIDWRWLLMELGTLAVGAALLRRYRLPFLVMPIAITLWYTSMDLGFYFARDRAPTQVVSGISVAFGLAMVAVGLWLDLGRGSGQADAESRSGDFAFWLYMVGVLSFWVALPILLWESPIGRFLFLCINLTMIALGTVLSRRVFVVFGALGTAGYVFNLTSSLFLGAALPLVLALVGLGIVYLGVLWQRHEREISERLRALLPAPWRQTLAHRG